MRLDPPHPRTESEAPTLSFPRDYLYLARKHWRLAACMSFLCLGAAAAVVLFAPKRYESTAKILVEQPSSGPALGGQAGSVLADLVGSPSASTLETQAEIVRSRPQLERVMNTLAIREPIERFERRISVQHPKLTDLLLVSATTNSANGAAAIANELTAAYQDFVQRRYKSVTSSSANDVRKRLQETEAKLQAVNHQVIAWLKARRFADPENEFAAVLRQRLALDAENRELRWARAGLVEKEASLKRELDRHGRFTEAVRKMGRTAEIDALRTTLANLHISRANAAVEFREDQPEVRSFDDQIAAAEQRLRRALASSLDGEMVLLAKEDRANPVWEELATGYVQNQFEIRKLDARQTALNAVLPKLKLATLRFPGSVQSMKDITRRQAALSSVWGMLMNKYEELKVREYVTAMRTTVIEPAMPPIRPTAPRPVLYMAVGLLLAIVFSSAAVGFAEAQERRICGGWDSERWLGVRTLSRFPAAVRFADREAITNGRIRPAADALLGNLTLIGAGTGWRVLSVIPAEESANSQAIAASLASAACASGLRVVLVDTRPDRHGIGVFFTHPEDGPNPEIVAVSPKDAWLAKAEAWREESDLVIVNCAPLTASPAACMAARMSDRVLAVVSSGQTAATVCSGCLSILDQGDAAVVGIALIDAA